MDNSHRKKMENTSTYIPSHIEVVIPKVYEKVPHVLFQGAKSLEEVQKTLHKKFITTNEKIKVHRKLDNFEVKFLRENYSQLLENKLPVVQEQLAVIEEDTKRVVKEAKYRLAACETQIQDLASQVRDGKKEITIEQNQCYRIPACGHYLFFAWLNDEFSLVRVEKIPEWDANKIFSQGEQNVEAFKTIFGIDIVALLDERKAAMDSSDEQSEPEEPKQENDNKKGKK